MGIEYNALKSFIIIKKQTSSLGDIATLGRQGLHIKKNKIVKILKKEKINVNTNEIEQQAYSESLLKILGAKSIDSFDVSNYEKATFVHDMNEPIPPEFKNKYDIVFDGGCLEHIFNFPIAIRNCMEMLKKEGYFLSITTCNNFSGHGFYQFSPELFFRIFNKENGFEIKDIFISEKNKWYKVKDPEEIRSRVTFRNKNETYIIVLAKKIEQQDIFKKTPQQSDYVECWNSKLQKQDRKIFEKITNKIKNMSKRFFIKYDKKFFTKIK
jgi:SAM-dependent methyltransferase